MYNENEYKEKKDYSLLKNFILKIIAIIIFVLLLVWIVPWPDMSGIDVLREQIFNNNITAMKEAAIPYFTTERLPQKVGDKVTLTLQEMLDLHLLTPFVDKNGNTCDLKASYVRIEKLENEYLMKVNLKCTDKEDYIEVHLGCYSYCNSYICEKQEDPTPAKPTTNKPKPSSNPTGPTPTYIPTSKPTPTETVKPTPTETVKPTPTETVKPTPTPSEDNKPTPSDDVKPAPTPDDVDKTAYLYRYVKKTDTVYSDWSSWTLWKYNNKSDVDWGNTTLYEIQDLGARYVKIGTKTTSGLTYSVQEKVLGKVSYEVCTGYNYVADATTLYTVTSDWADVAGATYSGYNPPEDATMTTRWVLKDYDIEVCTGDCTNRVYGVWQKQTRTVSVATTYDNVVANCASTERREIDVLTYVPIYTTYSKTEPYYGYVNYYRDRTRTVISKATITYTWSTSSDDKALRDQGYSYTGEYKKVS